MASIIDKKYAERYKAAEKDWAAQFIDQHVVTQHTKTVEKKDEAGNITTETVTLKKTSLDLDKLFALADANHLDTASLKAQRGNPNAPGRIRMTIGNQLRAAAKHRHGLFNLDGTFVSASAEFIGDTPKTQNPDGSKIVVEKPAEQPQSDAA